jgi:hypothetical protein
VTTLQAAHTTPLILATEAGYNSGRAQYFLISSSRLMLYIFWAIVHLNSTDVSEEHIASIFSVKENKPHKKPVWRK